MGSIYSMQKRTDGWVISVGNDELLTCSRKTTAKRVIQHAALGLDFVGDLVAEALDDTSGGRCPRTRPCGVDDADCTRDGHACNTGGD